MRIFATTVLAALLVTGCNDAQRANSAEDRSTAITAIKKAEADFARMAADKGIAEAFWFYADSNAVIKREYDTLIHGKDAIRNYYTRPGYVDAKVDWAPDFTDASTKGDFGYTYGKYTWHTKDSTGKALEFKGVFHTVWKKQADGSWKYVWD